MDKEVVRYIYIYIKYYNNGQKQYEPDRSRRY